MSAGTAPPCRSTSAWAMPMRAFDFCGRSRSARSAARVRPRVVFSEARRVRVPGEERRRHAVHAGVRGLRRQHGRDEQLERVREVQLRRRIRERPGEPADDGRDVERRRWAREREGLAGRAAAVIGSRIRRVAPASPAPRAEPAHGDRRSRRPVGPRVPRRARSVRAPVTAARPTARAGGRGSRRSSGPATSRHSVPALQASRRPASRLRCATPRCRSRPPHVPRSTGRRNRTSPTPVPGRRRASRPPPRGHEGRRRR